MKNTSTKKYAVCYPRTGYGSLIYDSLDEVQDMLDLLKRQALREGCTYHAPTVHEVLINPEPMRSLEAAVAPSNARFLYDT